MLGDGSVSHKILAILTSAQLLQPYPSQGLNAGLHTRGYKREAEQDGPTWKQIRAMPTTIWCSGASRPSQHEFEYFGTPGHICWSQTRKPKFRQ